MKRYHQAGVVHAGVSIGCFVAMPLWKQPVALRNKWEFRTKRVAVLMVIGVAS